MERVWRALKDDLAWQPFPHVDAPQDDVGQWLRPNDASTRHSLTRDAYLVEAINALAS
jgi:hypothetical protein